MSLCPFASCLRSTSSYKAAKRANHLISRSLKTSNYNLANVPVDNFLSDDGENTLQSEPFDATLLSRLHQNGSFSSPHLLNRILSFYAKSGFFYIGLQLHGVVTKMGFLSNVYICSALLDLYGKFCRILDMQKLFDEMPQRSVVTWNSLISGYLNVDRPDTALHLFRETLKEGTIPSPVSFSAAFVCCSRLKAGDFTAQIHCLCLKVAYACNVVVETGLVDVYLKCLNFDKARRVFDGMQEKNVVTWSCMIGGYAQNGNSREAMSLAREMLRLGIRLNYVTYNSLLSSLSSSVDFHHCKQVHCGIIRDGFYSNVYIAVTLVTAYSRCRSSLDDFHRVCSGVKIWDQISWNAVISGYSNLGCGDKALKCFSEMRLAGIELDHYTLASVLGATGMVSALQEGKQIHALVVKSGYDSDICLQNGVLSMYARCGAIRDSRRAFSSIGRRDVVSWNSLLSGCAHHGYGKEAIELFEQMRKTEVKPDSTTFLALLSACSHGGFLDKGLGYFSMMRNDPSLEPPKMEHYAVIVDLLGRAGCLTEAETFVNSMPLEPGPTVYKALLSACGIHGNKDIATRTAEKLLELWPDDAATYVLLSKVFISEGRWHEAAIVRNLMYDKGARIKPAYSWV